MSSSRMFDDPLLNERVPTGYRLFLSHVGSLPALWMLESVLALNYDSARRIEVTALARHPDRFAARFPHLAEHPALRLVRGEASVVKLPRCDFDAVLHFIEDPKRNGDPLEEARRLLDWAGASPRFLQVGGAVIYGNPSPGAPRIVESYRDEETPVDNALAQQRIEALGREALTRNGANVLSARVFDRFGPQAEPDQASVSGAFLRDALAGGPINIPGDGTDLRSHLFGPDLTRGLWLLLLDGVPGEAYNLAADQEASNRELAEIISAEAGDLPIVVDRPARKDRPARRFIGDSGKIRERMGWRERFTIEQGIELTLKHFRALRELERGDLAKARAVGMNLLADQV
jgi:nucleoside-diphosphate-sugar epimerase